MNIISSLNSENNNSKSAVTIGTFDGVHIGHQKIIEQLVQTANQENLKSCVLTFFPHPRMVLQKDADIKLINTIDERTQLLENLGLDLLFIKTFSESFSRWTAEDFVEKLLVQSLNAKKVIIGYDHRFGRNRSASVDELTEFGGKFGFEVIQISKQDVNDVAVSSTKIRNALNDGDIETANSYLGYHFMISGIVVKGKQLGTSIAYPTANLNIKESYKLIPKQGSYIVYSEIKGEKVYGMMNIGMNPTVDGTKESIEVHFFNFNRDLYNQAITVRLLHRIREEFQFESVDELKNQLEKDKKYSLEYIQKHHA